MPRMVSGALMILAAGRVRCFSCAQRFMLLRAAIITLAVFSGLSCRLAWAVPGDAIQHAPSKEAATAVKGIRTEDHLRVELYASEPLVKNAVAFSPDAKGRWFIAESYRQERGVEDNRGHMNWLDNDLASRRVEDRLAFMKKFYPDPAKFTERFATAEERVVMVEDSDNDGVADRMTVTADGFRDPLDGTGAGVLARGKHVWWTCIPSLWRFTLNPEGGAAARDVLLTGFGVKFAFRGHDMHGLRMGPDGRLYFSIGDRGLNVNSKEGRNFEVPNTGCVMRCMPDGTEFEIFATGLRNPQDLAFNEFGDLFTGDNNSDSGDRARFVHVAEGGDSGWRMTYQYMRDRGPWNREGLWDDKKARSVRYVVPPIANFSDGPSGLTYNPGTALSDKYRSTFFLSDFRGGASASIVHAIRLDQDGAGYRLKDRQNAVRGVLTTDVEFGPDGGLYVLDWVESWSGVNKGRIHRIVDDRADRTLQENTRSLLETGFEARPPEELAGLLDHQDFRVRQEAQFALAERGNNGLPAMTKAALEGRTVLGRLHAIWGLGQIGIKHGDALKPLQGLLGDKENEVRAQSAKVLGERKTKSAAARLTELLSDPAARVKYQAAIALGKMRHEPAMDALFKLAAESNDRDPLLRHAIAMGLVGCTKDHQLASKSTDPNPAVRGAAVVALRRQGSKLVSAFLNDNESSIVLETARAIHDVPITDALPALAALTTLQGGKPLTDLNLGSRVVNANYRLGGREAADRLAAVASQSRNGDSVRRDAIAALSAWANPDPKDRVLYLWRPLPARADTDAAAAAAGIVTALLETQSSGIQEAAAEMCAQLKLKDAGAALAKLASRSDAKTGARLAALRALGTLKDSRLADAAQVALRDRDSKLRTEALQIVARQDPESAVRLIAEVIEKGEPAEKQGAIAALVQMNKSEPAKKQIEALMDRLLAGTAPTEIELEIAEAAKRAGLMPKVEQYQALLAEAAKTDPLAPYRMALKGGDVERGRKIFREKAEVSCIRCHKCEIGDSLVGPDLTRIGANKDRKYLLESIVYPNRHIAEGFQMVMLAMKDDRILAGRILREDSQTVVVETLDDKGKVKPTSAKVADIKERISAPSPMPDTTRDQLSRRELRDLIEYLATRK